MKRGDIGWGVLAGLFLAGCTMVMPTESPPPPPPTSTVALPTETLTPTPLPTLTPTPTSSPESWLPGGEARNPALAPTISLGFLTPRPKATATPKPETAATPTPAILSPFPERIIPEPFGVNIHFTSPQPGELELLEKGGFRFVRMDLFWSEVERERGQYDFSAYDKLVAAMEEQNIRIIFILDYGNNLYGGGPAVLTDEGRAGFARFAGLAVRRYRGKGIIWEIWNEPNLSHFWHADPNPQQYARLANDTVTAIRQVDPTAWIIGPATSGFPWPFFEGLAESGLFTRLDAVSVHPYRFEAPETAQFDLLRLRALLDRVSPNRRIPILSGEWGYATAAMGINEERQANYLTRQWLFNLANDVNVSIWYDWRNDGLEPDNVEHHFGTVTNSFEPKPSYLAAQTLNHTLAGYRFLRRIPTAKPEDVMLLFGNGEKAAVAAWTVGVTHAVTLPLPCNSALLVEIRGDRSQVRPENNELELELRPAPRYLHLCDVEMVQRTISWRPEETMVSLPGGIGRVLVVVENNFPDVLQGEFLVRWGEQVLGRTPAEVPPGAVQKFSIPVLIEGGLPEPTQARVEFLTPDDLPLQSALIWLLTP